MFILVIVLTYYTVGTFNKKIKCTIIHIVPTTYLRVHKYLTLFDIIHMSP